MMWLRTRDFKHFIGGIFMQKRVFRKLRLAVFIVFIISLMTSCFTFGPPDPSHEVGQMFLALKTLELKKRTYPPGMRGIFSSGFSEYFLSELGGSDGVITSASFSGHEFSTQVNQIGQLQKGTLLKVVSYENLIDTEILKLQILSGPFKGLIVLGSDLDTSTDLKPIGNNAAE